MQSREHGRRDSRDHSTRPHISRARPAAHDRAAPPKPHTHPVSCSRGASAPCASARRRVADDVQEWSVQVRVLLGLLRRVEGPLGLLLRVQQVRPGQGQGQPRPQEEGFVSRGARALPALLHALHESRPVAAAGDGGPGEDGEQGQGDGEPRHQYMDGLPVPQRGQRGAARVPVCAQVHVRLRLLPAGEAQLPRPLRDAADGAREADGGPLRVAREARRRD
mmetsp:Transcript_61267/g.168186  ORF Transcript_61267/g.168186 Transcript_61267/m.168186 type:complete len:221 (+) Transcript_61267:328-990(+)